MQIKQFKLHDIGRFKSLEVSLAPTPEVDSNITVLVGNNGAGKTSILKSLATSLSWFISRLRSEKGSGNPIPEEVIFKSSSSAAIEITVMDEHGQAVNPNIDKNEFLYRWTLSKARRGKKAEHSSQLNDASRLANDYRVALTNDDQYSLPLIAFYPVERVVLDIPLKIREKHNFFQLDGYDNSLNQGVDFRRFFEWFREREDAENESGIPQEMLAKIFQIVDQNSSVWQKLQQLRASSRDRQLTAVRTAISNFMPGFTNLKVRRKPWLHMSIDKDGETFNVLQLSQGEKSLMALVGDIARRLSMMNPSLENPLQGDGIVLIDEVDMHLHPTWQRSIIERLTMTFPNCQFVLTTHSPLVISDYKDVLVYSLENGNLVQVPSQYGQDANSVLLDVMDTQIRNQHIAEKFNDLLDLIQDRKLAKARELLESLEQELPESNIELTKAKLLLRKQELRIEKN